MAMKQVVTIVLLVFVAGSFGYLLIGKSGDIKTEDPPETVAETANIQQPVVGEVESPSEKPNRRLIAYYLHGSVRCPTCLAIEEYAKEAIMTAFPSELASGALEWQSLNTDEVWNSHYWKDFELSFSSLVIADVSGTETVRFKNLEKVWELVHEKKAFFDYVQSETKTFL